jgi:triosephosphate isomerase
MDGAQDLFWADAVPHTGEVGGDLLREVGCRYAQVGQAERRTLRGEGDDTVARKTAAALRNGPVPQVCVGEAQRGSVTDAARECVRQLDAALSDAREAGLLAPVVVGGSRVIYGGEAGPGTLTRLAPHVDGLMLEHSPDDMTALHRILDEAASVLHSVETASAG